MKIYEISGRHLEITQAMREYISKKLQHLENYSTDVIDAKVVMSYSKSVLIDEPHKAEIQLNLPSIIIRAEERSRDAYQAIDTAIVKLERQLVRHKNRHRPDHKAKATDSLNPIEELDSPAIPRSIDRVKKHALRPMTPEDAAFQMEFLGHAFYMFRNSLIDEVNVVYVRHDGSYGLLQAK